MKDRKKTENIAAKRIQMVSPLLAEGLDVGQIRTLKAEICPRTGISERTLRRYLVQYRTHGFEGVKPGHQRQRQDGAIPAELLDQAILLRREVPTHSVAQIIQLLEWESKAAPCQLKRSTLQGKLTEAGYSSRHLRMYASTGVAVRRFQRRHRNELWQSDIKHGPYLPIDLNRTKKQVYLVVMLDDATRFVLHVEFYPTMDQVIVEDCFRQAIQN